MGTTVESRTSTLIVLNYCKRGSETKMMKMKNSIAILSLAMLIFQSMHVDASPATEVRGVYWSTGTVKSYDEAKKTGIIKSEMGPELEIAPDTQINENYQ